MKKKLVTFFIRTTNLKLGPVDFNISGSSEYEKDSTLILKQFYFGLFKNVFWAIN